MTTLIDTNIVIALIDNNESLLHKWAVDKFNELKANGPLLISDTVYCESSVGMPTQEALDQAINKLGIDRISASDKALFIAGKAYKHYKEVNKGPKTGVLPDFIIGATAEAMELPLLTSNPRDFTGYFPAITIIRPEPTPIQEVVPQEVV